MSKKGCAKEGGASKGKLENLKDISKIWSFAYVNGGHLGLQSGKEEKNTRISKTDVSVSDIIKDCLRHQLCGMTYKPSLSQKSWAAE